MKMPHKTSMAYKILKVFIDHGPMSIMDACVFHGQYSDTVNMDIKDVYEWHVDNGFLEIKNDLYDLTNKAKKHFGKEDALDQEYLDNIAQPRIVDNLNRPAWVSNLDTRPRRNW